ncbi:DUF6221 family protein [Isoptericola sp. NPDC055881]
MTITEFLTARLDEDEAAVRDAELHLERGVITREISPWELIVDSHPDVLDRTGGRPLVTIHPDRVRAEVEAKRHIVAYWADPAGQWDARQAEAARAQKDRTLRVLALPYAEHHDYDESWRP